MRGLLCCAAIVCSAASARADLQIVDGKQLGAVCHRYDHGHPFAIRFRLKLARPIASISIVGHNRASLAAAKAHGRVAAIEVTTDGSKKHFELDDPFTERALPTIPGRPPSDEVERSPTEKLTLPTTLRLPPATTKQVTIEVLRVEPGTRHADVCIASIELFETSEPR